jgi:hypothetical protein
MKELKKKFKFETTKKTFKKVIEDDFDEEQIFYFTLDQNQHTYEKKLKEPFTGKYLTLLFLSCNFFNVTTLDYKLGGSTIDIEKISFFGKSLKDE